jgi:hypothetical protein
MAAMPLLGAFIGEQLPSGSGDYGGSFVKVFHMAVGFALGGVCSICLALVIRARRHAR